MTQSLAIITGTSSGIGASLAAQLLSKQWLVFGISRREVNFSDANYMHILADLADPAALTALSSRIEAELAFRSIDRFALVNNAATPGQRRAFGDQNLNATYQNIAVNLAAPMALMDLAIRLRPEESSLRIVNVSSGLAYRPLAATADYCASKAGLHMAGEVLAEEHHPSTAVLSYAPGIVDTEMQQTLRGESEQDFPSVEVFKAMFDEGRLAEADDVTGPIIRFLEDDEASGFSTERYEP